MPPHDDDWRIRNQERYLQGATVTRATYRAPRADWDHDHCEFCNAKFMEPGHPDTLHDGFMTTDGRWICPTCFNDFRDRFRFQQTST